MKKTALYLLFVVLLSCIVSAISVTENDLTISSETEYANCNGRRCYYDFTVKNEKRAESQNISVALFTNSFKADVTGISRFDEDIAHPALERYWESGVNNCSRHIIPEESDGSRVYESLEPVFLNTTCTGPLLKERIFNNSYDDFISLSFQSQSGLRISDVSTVEPTSEKLFRITFKAPLLSVGKFDINVYSSAAVILDPFIINTLFVEPFDDTEYIDNDSTINASLRASKAWLSPGTSKNDTFSDGIINTTYYLVTMESSGGVGNNQSLESDNRYQEKWTCNANQGANYMRVYTRSNFSYIDGNMTSYLPLNLSFTLHTYWSDSYTTSSNPRYMPRYSLYGSGALSFFNETVADATHTWNMTFYINHTVKIVKDGSEVSGSPFDISGIDTGGVYWFVDASGLCNPWGGSQIIYNLSDYVIYSPKINSGIVQSINLSPVVPVSYFIPSINDSDSINCSYYYSTDNSTWSSFSNGTIYEADASYPGFFWKAILNQGCEIYDLSFNFGNGTSNESSGRAAIELGIAQALSGNYTVYTDQKVVGRHVNGTQLPGAFDKFVVYPGTNQMWAFNYDPEDSANFTGMFNITPTLYVLEIFKRVEPNITVTVREFITNTRIS